MKICIVSERIWICWITTKKRLLLISWQPKGPQLSDFLVKSIANKLTWMMNEWQKHICSFTTNPFFFLLWIVCRLSFLCLQVIKSLYTYFLLNLSCVLCVWIVVSCWSVCVFNYSFNVVVKPNLILNNLE